MSTDDLVRRVGPFLPPGATRLALRIAQRLNIGQRHMVRSFDSPLEVPRDGDNAAQLAARAVRAAWADAGPTARPTRMFIGHTTTPHTLLPGNIAWVAQELDSGAAHIELRQACTGFAAGAVLAASLVSNGVGPVAIVGSETGSVFLDPRRVASDRSQLINLVQMGDGAGAIVLDTLTSENSARIEYAFYGSLPGHRKPGISLVYGGSGCPHAPCADTSHFDHDFESVRREGLSLLRASFAAACGGGTRPESIRWWIVHPANGRMAQYVADSLDLPVEKIICEADRLGNLGSAAIWVALDRLRRSGILAPGDRVMALGAEASKYMYGGFLYVHGTSGQ